MSGIDVFRDPDEVIREAERRDEEIEREREPMQERGHGEGSDPNAEPEPEPDATDEEGSEDNDGGPPAG